MKKEEMLMQIMSIDRNQLITKVNNSHESHFAIFPSMIVIIKKLNNFVTQRNSLNEKKKLRLEK